MAFENEGRSEQDTLDALASILPEDGYNIGQSQEPDEAPVKEAEQKPDNAEAKVEAKPEDAEPDEIEIDYEGNRYKLPKELKDAFLRQQDYTKKTMELAEQKKMLAQADPKEIETYKQKLTHYETILGNAVAQDQRTDWIKLLESDPVEYLKQKELAEVRAREWQQISAKRQEELAKQQSQALTNEWEQLLAKRPEWKDEAVRKADREGIEKFLAGIGYAKEDIAAIADHRALLVADKARRYDELMASKSEVVKKIEKLPPKIERPGVPSASEGQVNKTAMQSLRKSGSIDDAAAALRGLMG